MPSSHNSTSSDTRLQTARQTQTVPKVYVVLLNYKGADDTLACLESLRQLTYPNYEIIVVDNASPDDSVSKIQSAKQKNDYFHLIMSDENRGFSAGNNLAIQYVLDQSVPKTAQQVLAEAGLDPQDISDLADEFHDLNSSGPINEEARNAYIWLLNNDTTVEPNCLDHMMQIAVKTGGIVGSLIMYPDRSYQQVGTRIQWLTGSTKGYSATEISDGMPVQCLSGASMLVPVTTFRRIGLLDERYFLYFEDAEFCIRAQQKKIPINLAIKARVYHYEGKTTGKKSLATQYYFHRNRLKLLFTYATIGQRLTISLYMLFRLLREWLKKTLNPSRDRLQSWTVQQLALTDFIRGVNGPCPHNLTHR